jgi:dihydrodipicolinate synthase/N-acetylneuraminate lyase
MAGTMVVDITVRTGTGATGTTDTMDIMETATNAEFDAFVATEILAIQF